MHLGHQCATLMKQIAAERCYWPGMMEDIEEYYKECDICWEHGKSQPPAIVENSPPPTMPFEQICIDMNTIYGNQYIVMVDRFSGYIWMDICPKGKEKS